MAQPDATDAPQPSRSPPPSERPPRQRHDPAAMRETLDAARRRLGSDLPGSGEPQSAAELRSLLREAAAAHGEPRPPVGSPTSPPTIREHGDTT